MAFPLTASGANFNRRKAPVMSLDPSHSSWWGNEMQRLYMSIKRVMKAGPNVQGGSSFLFVKALYGIEIWVSWKELSLINLSFLFGFIKIP
jgi:hypothetical protein